MAAEIARSNYQVSKLLLLPAEIRSQILQDLLVVDDHLTTAASLLKNFEITQTCRQLAFEGLRIISQNRLLLTATLNNGDDEDTIEFLGQHFKTYPELAATLPERLRNFNLDIVVHIKIGDAFILDTEHSPKTFKETALQKICRFLRHLPRLRSLKINAQCFNELHHRNWLCRDPVLSEFQLLGCFRSVRSDSLEVDGVEAAVRKVLEGDVKATTPPVDLYAIYHDFLTTWQHLGLDLFHECSLAVCSAGQSERLFGGCIVTNAGVTANDVQVTRTRIIYAYRSLLEMLTCFQPDQFLKFRAELAQIILQGWDTWTYGPVDRNRHALELKPEFVSWIDAAEPHRNIMLFGH